MLKLEPKTYKALGGILVAFVLAVHESGIVPPAYAGIVGSIATTLALLMGKKPEAAP